MQIAEPEFVANPLQLAVHRGPAMVTTLNDRLDYFGNSVHLARQLLAIAGPRELLMTDAVAGLEEVSALLRENGMEAVVEGMADGSVIVHRCFTSPGKQSQ